MSETTSLLVYLGTQFSILLNVLYSSGWMRFIFPLMLVYSLVFATTGNIKLIQKNKATRVLVSFIFSIIAISAPFTEDGRTVGDMMFALFPGVSIFAILILSIYIVAGLFDVDIFSYFSDEKHQEITKLVFLALGLVFILFYFIKGYGFLDGTSFGWLVNNPIIAILTDPVLYMLIIGIALFVFLSIDAGENDGEKKENSKS